jgi:hypothetical protein
VSAPKKATQDELLGPAEGEPDLSVGLAIERLEGGD